MMTLGITALGDSGFFFFFSLRKVWQRRKCMVKNGILTISHATVSTSLNCSPLDKLLVIEEFPGIKRIARRPV